MAYNEPDMEGGGGGGEGGYGGLGGGPGQLAPNSVPVCCTSPDTVPNMPGNGPHRTELPLKMIRIAADMPVAQTAGSVLLRLLYPRFSCCICTSVLQLLGSGPVRALADRSKYVSCTRDDQPEASWPDMALPDMSKYWSVDTKRREGGSAVDKPMDANSSLVTAPAPLQNTPAQVVQGVPESQEGVVKDGVLSSERTCTSAFTAVGGEGGKGGG